MNTIEETLRVASAVVTGARHLRSSRNGQDAAVTLVAGEVAVAVVCDGCSSGASSEVGARLGATLVARALIARLVRGEQPSEPAMWTAVRTEVAAMLRLLAEDNALALVDSSNAVDTNHARIAAADTSSSVRPADVFVAADASSSVRPADVFVAADASSSVRPADVFVAADASSSVRPADVFVADAMATLARARSLAADAMDAFVRDHLLFTIVAAAITRDEAAVWAIGDGAYVVDGETQALGPFANNEPPYLAYDLYGDARPAHFQVLAPGTRTIVIATDGALDLSAGELGKFAAARFLAHPDALRRQLAILARPEERIDWDERRVLRTPAPLQDDCAIAIVQRVRELV
jgi:hypothetical protein